ncbi:MAG: TylF/MycF/NovP-related O-methyltransferase [Elsteraceae bacterium]
MPPVWQGHDLEDLYYGKISAPSLMSANYLAHFFLGSAGGTFGLGVNDKIDLFNKFAAHVGSVEGHGGVMKHIFLADRFLSMPASVKGDLVECGVFKGASAASLSHLADRVRRRLIICDSFKGLPPNCEPESVFAHYGRTQPMKEGDFAGSRAEVEKNLREFGMLGRVDFIEGYFHESLKALKGPIAFAFIDVKLVSSTKDCLRAIWPLLSPGGMIVTDDAPDMNVAKVYFDDVWWRETLGCDAPGLIGAGCGVWLNASGATGQGYCVKR